MSMKNGERRERGGGSSPDAPANPGLFKSRTFRGLALLVALAAAYIGVNRSTGIAENREASRIYGICSQKGRQVYTVDANNTQAECVVVRGNKIADVGSIESTATKWSTKTPLQVYYLSPGSMLVPGLSDSHAHVLETGAARLLSLEGTRSVQEIVTLIRNFILAHPVFFNDPSKFIIGGGWDHTAWPVQTWPSAADLDNDPVIRGRRVVLQSKDCHAMWISSAALELSLPLPENVDGGIIVRNGTGIPTGVFLDNAQDLVNKPKLTEDDLLLRFKVAVRDALSLGLTSIHDAGLDPTSLAFFKRQADAGALPIRIYGMTYFNETAEYWGDTTKPVIGLNNGRFTARSVKIFADGALRTGGAALHEPYSDNPSTHGFMRVDPEVLFEWVPKLMRDGWQVNIHAIGDRANAIVLDVFELSLKAVDAATARPRLEHAQVMTKEDMERLGRLGVIASIQPTHAISDMWYAGDRLGPERIKGLYAFRSFIDSGAKIALGSDSPVETISPFSGFYAAITRLSPEGDSPHGPDGWFPEERLSRVEALRGMTIDPAYASFTESILGSIEIGKLADLVILSQDLMTVPADQILATKVLSTIIDGEVVYGKL